MTVSAKMVRRWGGFWAVLGLVLWFSGTAVAVMKIPEFSEKTVLGDQTVTNESFKGKVLLVNFWATWCPPCRREIPSLIKFQREYADRGFQVLGISVDQGGQRVVRKFVKRMDMNYPVIIGNSRLSRKFGGVAGIPVSFLVDRQGNLVRRIDGYVAEDVFRKEIERLLH